LQACLTNQINNFTEDEKKYCWFNLKMKNEKKIMFIEMEKLS